MSFGLACRMLTKPPRLRTWKPAGRVNRHRGRVKMSEEVKRCRLLALLERELGPVQGARPKLRAVGDASVNALTSANEPARRYLRPTEARKAYGWPSDGMKTGSDG